MKNTNGDYLAQLTKTLKSSSAAVPSLVYTALVTPIAIGAAAYSGDMTMKYIFAGIAATPVILTGLQIGFFSFFDRDRLQNEEHVENKMLINKIAPQLGDGNKVIELDPNEDLVENPSAKGAAE